MWKASIKPGTQYAIREKPSAPYQRVKVLEPIRGSKWKVKWIDPNPGLVDFIESKMIIVPWRELKAMLKDQERERQLDEYNKKVGYKEGSPVALAVDEVFTAANEMGMNEESVARLQQRAGLKELKRSPSTYTDRHGTLHQAFDEQLELARAFCAVEPTTVLVNVDVQESEWERRAREEGGEHRLSTLNEYRAAWALIRQWTGHDAALGHWQRKVQRLERLVWDAIYALHEAGKGRGGGEVEEGDGEEITRDGRTRGYPSVVD